MGITTQGFTRIVSLATVSLGLALSACTSTKDVSETSPEVIQTTPSENIIGGAEIDDGAVLSRSVVLLINAMTQEVCTATLIGDNFALTAAHCLDKENTENMYVFFAAKPNNKTTRRRVLNAKESPYWELRQNEEKNTSDIAVIKFEGPGLPNGYEPVSFLENTSLLKNGLTTIVLGYGITDPVTQTGAGKLRYTNLRISDAHFSPTELLLDQTKGSGVCHGDSGGPAFIHQRDKSGKVRYYLWGIANHSSKDDVDNLCNNGVIYTNATLFQTWIELVKRSL